MFSFYFHENEISYIKLYFLIDIQEQYSFK